MTGTRSGINDIMSWHCPVSGRQCHRGSCLDKANKRAWGTMPGQNWPGAMFNGRVDREDCDKDEPITCGRGTCQRGPPTCQHGHGIIKKQAPGHPAGWVHKYGRGCCPKCKEHRLGPARLEHASPH